MTQVAKRSDRAGAGGMRSSEEQAAVETAAPPMGQIRASKPWEYLGLIGGVMLWIAMGLGFLILCLTWSPGPAQAILLS